MFLIVNSPSEKGRITLIYASNFIMCARFINFETYLFILISLVLFMKIAIIGGGAMGSALANGLLLKKDIDPQNITISNPHLEKLAALTGEGIKITDNNTAAIKDASLIVIAVKPWKVAEVVNELLPALDPKTMEVAIIVAGISAETIERMFGDKLPSNISIVMPNTAMVCGKSMTFLVSINGENLLAREIFSQVGEIKIIEERLLPAATALASCGIAYAMRYVRAATEGGVELGFRASEAQDIIRQTVEGAMAILNTPGAHPETEIDKVTTPGGITIKGLNAMDQAGFSSAVVAGLKASAK